MNSEVRQFVLKVLRDDMNLQVDDKGDPPLGPAGIDLESLGVAELALHVEERYGVAFGDEELEQVAGMTLDGFSAEVARRAHAADREVAGE